MSPRMPIWVSVWPGEDGGPPEAGGVQPTVRKNFADTAVWKAAVETNKDGIAEVTFPMPEQLTGWKIRVWGLGHGTKVGQGEAEVVTKKDLLLRLQAPRFFTQKDEVVLSANVHNYLKKEKDVAVSLEVEGGTLHGGEHGGDLGDLVTGLHGDRLERRDDDVLAEGRVEHLLDGGG